MRQKTGDKSIKQEAGRLEEEPGDRRGRSMRQDKETGA
jgi:hypothetical protein